MPQPTQPIQTIAELFLLASRFELSACLMEKLGGSYQTLSTAELVDRVRRLGQALGGLGIEKGDRVALMAENGFDWPTVDFATLCHGAVLVPIYPTLPPDQAAYVARDSGAKVLFVQGEDRLEGFLGLRSELPEIHHIVFLGGASPRREIPSLAEVIAREKAPDAAAFEARAREVRPADLATFIYTSGTTGKPKGVMLSHGNLASNLVATREALAIEEGFTALSFLPLSHSFERIVDYTYFYQACTIAYAESVQTVAANLQEVAPHVFVSVPRVYEKVLAKVHDNVARSSPTKQKIFHWAEGMGREALPYRLRHERPGGLLGVKLALADRLVFAKIKARLGGRFRFAVSGGAPLALEIAQFFWGAGIEIYEGYGLTETSPVVSVNTRDAVKLGTVGRPIRGVEVRIAPDGEVLVRGPNVLQGYYNNPEATAEVIDEEGWFHTGDIGQLDEEGFLAITDRKKEIIVNAYGKNIAPAPIENALKASRFVGQAVVLGDRRQFLSALLVPDFDALEAWAERQGIAAAPESLVADPRVRELFEREVEAVNADLARYEQIHAWELVPTDFTIEGGELTPTQKIKRRVIHEKYGDLIDRMYRAAEKEGAAS